MHHGIWKNLYIGKHDEFERLHGDIIVLHGFHSTKEKYDATCLHEYPLQ